MKFRSPARLPQSACAMFLGLFASISACIAQADWEAVYTPYPGGAAARGGVQQFSNCSSIAVAEALGQNGEYDIYVTYQGPSTCFASSWQYTYDIGGRDIPRKIRGTSTGGYIIVGTTQNTGTSCAAHNIFLMLINSAGAVIWCRTYGGTNVEEGWDVKEYPGGHFIVAGTVSSAGSGGRDGYIMRVDGSGAPVWGKAIGGTKDDYFISCTVAANGDVIAAGGTQSFTVGSADIFLARLDGPTGTPLPGFIRNYGTAGNEGAAGIIECANGDMALCGYSTGFGSNAQGIILRLSANGAVIAGHHYGGGANTMGWDEFRDITELQGGDLMVTGMFFAPVGGSGNYDLYVGRVSLVLSPVSQLLFGGAGTDQGWAIARSASGNPDGWMVAGMTTSYSAGSPEHMYLISRPDMNQTGCESVPSIHHGAAGVSQGTPASGVISYMQSCIVISLPTPQNNFLLVCGNCLPSPC